MVGIKPSKLDIWFSADAVPGKEDPRVVELRVAARRFAEVIIENSPPSPDQSHALRNVRDALQAASQAVVFDAA